MASPFLDTQNFKINSSAWKTQDAPAVINWKHTSIQIKINPEGDVREYINGPFAGQQLFTYHAALRETQKAKKSLPENQSFLEDAIASISWDTEIQKYRNYLTKVAIQFSWCFSSWSHVFDDIGIWAYYRLADGSRVVLTSETWSVARRDETMWYSVKVA